MAQEKSSIKERQHTNITEPSKYCVVLHNDDFTPMDLVVFILIRVFFLPFNEANRLMLKVHHEGKAKVGSYSYDIAVSKSAKATQMAREEGYPLRLTVEKL